MITTIFLAQVLGLYFTLLALALIFNRHSFNAFFHEAAHQRHIIILSGILSLIIGLIIIISVTSWHGIAILISLIGWFALITGLLRLFFTDWFADHIKRMTANRPYYALVAVLLVLGLILIVFGFIWPLTL